MDPLKKIALETIELDKQAIIFVPSRASAEKTAEDIAKLTKLSQPVLEEESLKAVSTPTKQCKRLSQCIRKGVAFHHAGLAQKQKDLIEDQFRLGNIKIIAATPTLAAGLSLPAFRVIIKSVKRFSGNWGMDWIPVLEYLQMAGRAGRPEYEKEGQSIIIAKDAHECDEIYQRYILGEPEEIYSKLAVEPVLRTYLLSLISSRIIKNKSEMITFFSKSFWAHQFQDMPKLELIMGKILALLEEWKFITTQGSTATDDFQPANFIQGEISFQPTLIGRRISQLYLDPLTAKYFLDCMAKFDETKNEFSLLQMISHTLELRPLLRTKRSEEDNIQAELIKKDDLLLEQQPSAFDHEYPEFINSIKTALFFDSWINEFDENYLFEQFNIRPGEIRYKLDGADWLLYAVDELAKITNNKLISSHVSRLRIRVKNGVKEELLPLLKLKGIGRIRARNLFSNQLTNLGDVKKKDLASLSQILGRALAASVKQQLGQEVVEIKSGKMSGQMSIKKF